MLCKKVARTKAFGMPERLPPTSSAGKFLSMRAYYQVMEWIGCKDEIELSEWGWRLEGQNLIPVITDKSPSSDDSLQP